MADPLEDPGYDFTLDDLTNTFRPSQNYGEGMTGDQTSRYDTTLNLTGSKDLANIAASGDLSSLFKNVGGAAKNLFTSPGGVAALGAILGAANRPQPTGGGTTMAYPGAAKLERKMVQGPYGPLAQYTGVGGGAPDYTPFTAPTFGAPDVGGKPPTTPAPSPGAGMSVQSKVDLYKQMAGYGLAPDRIRRIAETMYGPQTDSDWAELTRLAGVGAGIAAPAPRPGGIAAPTLPARVTAPPSDGGVTTPIGSTVRPEATDEEKIAKIKELFKASPGGGVRPEFERIYGPVSEDDWRKYGSIARPDIFIGTAAAPATDAAKIDKLKSIWTGNRTGADARQAFENVYGPTSESTWRYFASQVRPDLVGAVPSGIASFVSDMLPEEKAALYKNWKARGLSEQEVREMADKQFGKQPDSDWRSLQQIAATLPDDILPYLGPVPTDVQVRNAIAAWKSAQATSTPSPSPAPAASPAPDEPAAEMSEGYKFATQPDGIGIAKYYENIADFLRKNPTEEEIRAAMQQYGVSDLDVRRAQIIHGLPGKRFAQGGEARAYAGGRPLTMEDGGFVFTEEATQKLGDRGIAALGGKKISAPGNGTDDKGITSIIGKNGVTPARVSNGESYFPPGHDTKKLYALMHSLERKA